MYAWRAGTSNRVVVPARQAGNRFLGFLINSFTNTGSGAQRKLNTVVERNLYSSRPRPSLIKPDRSVSLKGPGSRVLKSSKAWEDDLFVRKPSFEKPVSTKCGIYTFVFGGRLGPSKKGLYDACASLFSFITLAPSDR